MPKYSIHPFYVVAESIALFFLPKNAEIFKEYMYQTLKS